MADNSQTEINYSKIFEIQIENPADSTNINKLSEEIKNALITDKIPEVVLKSKDKSIPTLILIVDSLRASIFDLYSILDIYTTPLNPNNDEQNKSDIKVPCMTAILTLKEPDEDTPGVFGPKSLDEMNSDCLYPQDFRYGSKSDDKRKKHGERFYRKNEGRGRHKDNNEKFRRDRGGRREQRKDDNYYIEQALAQSEPSKDEKNKNYEHHQGKDNRRGGGHWKGNHERRGGRGRRGMRGGRGRGRRGGNGREGEDNKNNNEQQDEVQDDLNYNEEDYNEDDLEGCFDDIKPEEK